MKYYALALVAVLTACGTNTAPAPTLVQVVTDTRGLVATVQATVAAIEVTNPKAISPPVQAAISEAEADTLVALATLSTAASPAATATTLQQIEGYLNPTLAAIGVALQADPALNAKYGLAFDAASALLTGVVEPYIQSVIPPTTAPATHP
jgi:hypothetical protein